MSKISHLRIVLFVVIFIMANGTISSIHAQNNESLLRVYNNETIQTSGNSFIIGGKQLTFRELKPSFTSGITKDLYKKARGQRFLGGVTTIVAIGALITSAVVRKDSKGGALALSIGGIGLNLWSFHLRKHSSELLDRAIWQRNKEILFEPPR
ncbi:MAG: hypothetical protein WKI04_03525 [Ferruginibacter sp.]